MNISFSRFIVSFLLIAVFLFSSFFDHNQKLAKASNSKVITVTFVSNPGNVSVVKAPLKYNKDFAFSFQMDDGSPDNYENGFKYMHGGTSATLNESLPGKFFTDGTGRSLALSSRSFKADFVWNSRNHTSNFVPLRTGINDFTWAKLLDAYNNGFDVVNHSWSHAAATTYGPDYIYDYPAPHGPSVLDYDYELTQNRTEVEGQGISMARFNMVPPAGDHAYIDPAFNLGYKFIASESSSFTYSGGTVPVDINGMNVTNTLNLDTLFAHRFFYTNEKSMTQYVDTVANRSRGADKYWGIGFTHRTAIDNTNGSLNEANFKMLMDHIEDEYGRDGDDSVWAASAEEVYEYLHVKQNTGVSVNTVGNVATITLDTSAVSNDLRRKALSLVVSSDSAISSIVFADNEFTSTGVNYATGLINLEWGAFFDSNDFSRVNTLVSAAETSRSQTDIDIANTYIAMLPASLEKNAFTSRIENIVPLGRRWLINLGVNSTTKLQDLVSGSPTQNLWWNEVNLVSSTGSNQTSQALVDTSNVNTTLTVVLPQSVATNSWAKPGASSEGQITSPDGLGAYPNSKMEKGLWVYNATSTTSFIQIHNLDPNKKYKVTVFGSTKNFQSGKNSSNISVQGVSQGPYNHHNNTSNTLIFSSVSPTVGGVIEIAQTLVNPAWSVAPINVIDISEVTPALPKIVFTSSTLRSQVSGLVDFVYDLTDDNSDPITLDAYQYSTTGYFSGEELTATPKTSDLAHDGVSGLTSSPNGISHTFVWDAIADLAGSEGFAYLRLKPDSLSQEGAYAYSSAVSFDFRAPTVSGISSDISNSANSISWSTHEPSYSFIEYGTTLSYGTSLGSLSVGSLVLNHNFNISSLSGCTVYNYRITTRDALGNQNTTGNYTFQTSGCPDPVASPVAGIYNSTQSVTLSAVGSSSIRYSTSGMPAHCTDGTLYSGPISVTETTTIYARACDISLNSTTASFLYEIDTVPPEDTIASPSAGIYNSTQSVTLSSVGSTSIRYSTSETPASCSVGTLYTTAISVASNQTIYTRACDNAGNSTVNSFAYVIDTEAPEAVVSSPVAGSYNSTQSVTLSSVGSTSIRYSTSETPASCSVGTLYTTAISVASNQTIYTRACDNAGNSTTSSFFFEIDTVPPVDTIASPVAGTYNTVLSVTLSSVGSTSIRYSTSETPASCSVGTLYTTAISVTSNQTIYTRACDNAGNSTVNSFAYVIDTVPPSSVVASPVAGTYADPISVSISSAGSDYIRYSLVNTPATCGTGSMYSTPIDVSENTTIYTRACDNAGNSTTGSFVYVVGEVIVPPVTPPVLNIVRNSRPVIMSRFISAPRAPSAIPSSPVLNGQSNQNLPNANAVNQNNVNRITGPVSNPIRPGIVISTMRLGFVSTNVRTVQQFLASQNTGPRSAALLGNGFTNFFGPLTRSALQEWQSANGLTPDGILGPKTRAKMLEVSRN
jgi:hypothetical protein